MWLSQYSDDVVGVGDDECGVGGCYDYDDDDDSD